MLEDMSSAYMNVFDRQRQVSKINCKAIVKSRESHVHVKDVCPDLMVCAAAILSDVHPMELKSFVSKNSYESISVAN